MDEVDCWNCGRRLPELPLPVSRHEYCPHCGEPVHCCRMCRHYAPDLADQCREDRAEPPTDRTAANFCDFFALNPGAASAGKGAGAADDDQARARLDALFGDAGEGADADRPEAGAGREHGEREASARARLDALFGDGKPARDDD